jgi:hypothetical protein
MARERRVSGKAAYIAGAGMGQAGRTRSTLPRRARTSSRPTSVLPTRIGCTTRQCRGTLWTRPGRLIEAARSRHVTVVADVRVRVELDSAVELRVRQLGGGGAIRLQPG